MVPRPNDGCASLVAQIAVVEDGLVRDEGRIGVRPEDLRAWAGEFLEPTDEIALEATTNSDAIAAMLREVVARVAHYDHDRAVIRETALRAGELPGPAWGIEDGAAIVLANSGAEALSARDRGACTA